MRKLPVGAALAAVLLLSACGGGGGGVNSTPTPPPTPTPTPTPSSNASLDVLANTESFTNDAVTANATFAGSTTATAKQSSLTIRYDAAAKSYTLTVEGRSLTFSPSDLDTALSTATLAVYVKKNGSTTDSLTLTKPGSAGRFTYKYVGGAFWQRTIQSAGSTSGSVAAASYGVETPDSAVPRTGTAQYDVDLIGYENTNSGIFANTGSGRMDVDFKTGNIVTNGTMTAAIMGDTVFSGVAKLNSSTNGFTGTFQFYDFGTFAGTIDGRFYGPGAEEVGAAYSASQADGRVAAGVILGRADGALTPNQSLTSLTSSQFFDATSAAKVIYTQGTDATSARSKSSDSVVVHYDATTKSYTLIAPDRSVYFGSDRPGEGPRTDIYSGYSTDSLLVDRGDLQYVAALQWIHSDSGKYQIENLAYGMRTPDSALPRSGSGAYALRFRGQAVIPNVQNRMNLGGDGLLKADFGSGSISLTGELHLREDWTLAGRAPVEATAALNGSGSLSSSANLFSGDLTVDGIGNYTGNFSGSFFGPQANEVGGTFTASEGTVGVLGGSFVGKGQAPVPALTDLNQTTQFASVASYSRQFYGLAGGVTLSYDPLSGAYVFTPYAYTGFSFSFGSADRVQSRSNSNQTYYERKTGANDTSGYLFNPGAGNTELALTYVSFADLLVTPSGAIAERFMFPFGLKTEAAFLPRTGSASYSGIVRGSSHSDDSVYLTGTSSLTANFGANSFTALLNLLSRDRANTTATPQPYGTVSFSGVIDPSGFQAVDPNGGDFVGYFFGPNADEFGAAWDTGSLYGVTVGKKN